MEAVTKAKREPVQPVENQLEASMKISIGTAAFLVKGQKEKKRLADSMEQGRKFVLQADWPQATQSGELEMGQASATRTKDHTKATYRGGSPAPYWVAGPVGGGGVGGLYSRGTWGGRAQPTQQDPDPFQDRSRS